jgi:hypothetical protein
MHPTDLEYDPFVTELISTSSTAAVLKEEIKDWYDDVLGSSIEVTLEQYDESGELVEDSGLDWYKSIYNITLNRYIDGKSVSNVIVMPLGAGGTITFNLPDTVQLSGEPLGGKFQIDCLNADGYTSTSWELEYDMNPWHIQHRL